MELPEEQDKSIFISWTVWATGVSQQADKCCQSVWMNKKLFISVPGSGNTSPKDMESLLPLMSMVIYSIDKAKKFRLNREVSSVWFCLLNFLWNWNHCRWVLMDPLDPYVSCMTARDPASCWWGNQYKLRLLLSVQRVNKKLTRTGLGWKRTSWSWPTCRGRRQRSPGGRRKNGRRRSGSWTRRIPRSSGGWRWGDARSHCYRLLADPPRRESVVAVAALIPLCWRADNCQGICCSFLEHRKAPGEMWTQCWRALFGSEMICLFLEEITCVYSDPCPCLQEAALRREQKKLEKKQMKMKQIKVKAMWLCCEKYLGATCGIVIHGVQRPT